MRMFRTCPRRIRGFVCLVIHKADFAVDNLRATVDHRRTNLHYQRSNLVYYADMDHSPTGNVAVPIPCLH